MNQNGLNNKLDRVDLAIANMRTNLNLAETDSIETVAEMTSFNLKNLMNVFIQPTEPATKHGIWIKQEHFDYDNVKVDETALDIGFFGIDAFESTLPNSNMGNMTVFEYDNTYYFVNGEAASSTSDRMYKFIPENQTIVEVPEFNQARIASGFTKDPSHGASVEVIDDIMYTHVTGYLICYNFKTCEYYTVSVPEDCKYIYNIGQHQKKVYIFSGPSYTSYIYNPKDGSFESFPAPPGTISSMTKVFFYAGEFLLPQLNAVNGNYTYGYNPETKEWRNIAQYKGYDMWGWHFDSRHTIFLKDANIIHFFDNRIEIYDLVQAKKTATYQYADWDLTAPLDSIVGFIYNNQVYITQGWKGDKLFKTAELSEPTPCKENTLVFRQGKYKLGAYQEVSLYNIPTEAGTFKWPVQSVLYYKDGKYHANLPTYYGNGTKWAKL